MTESSHAVLSPSSSSRWMLCPGAPILEEGEPNDENEYSKEGTFAHAVAAFCLEKDINAVDASPFWFDGKAHTIASEMCEFVQEYLDSVREQAKGHHLFIEQALDLVELTGEKNAKGTADSVIISKDGSLLTVIDFKYGFRKVSAFENSQLRMYGLAALEQFGMASDFRKVKLVIHQPRVENVDDEVLTIVALEQFGHQVRDAAKRVSEAHKSNSLNGYLNPGKKQCEWCRAAGKCPALAAQVAAATGADFEDETQKELIAPVDLGVAMAKIDMIEIWAKGVRAKVETELFSGRPVKDFKLVEGKKGNRNWIDETDAKKKLKALGVAPADMEVTELLSVAKLEKKIKGNAKALAELPKLFSQKAGQPSVAPKSDPRPAYSINPENDFEKVS